MWLALKPIAVPAARVAARLRAPVLAGAGHSWLSPAALY